MEIAAPTRTYATTITIFAFLFLIASLMRKPPLVNDRFILKADIQIEVIIDEKRSKMDVCPTMDSRLIPHLRMRIFNP
jgi:hypothetical protein